MIKRNIMSLLVVLTIALVSIAIYVANLPEKTIELEFSPPSFEPSVENGIPVVENESYSEIYAQGMSYKFSICGELYTSENKLELFLTNPKDNDVWLRIEIYDENNILIGETGIVKPDEYVKDVVINRTLLKGETIKLKIMAYEAETYYSEGSVIINSMIYND